MSEEHRSSFEPGLGLVLVISVLTAVLFLLLPNLSLNIGIVYGGF